MSGQQQQAPLEQAPRPRRRLRRILIRLAAALIVALALAAGAVQLALHSDLPRRIVISELEKELGLRVEIDSVRTGWSGRTAIEGLRLWLPLDDDVLAEVPFIAATHTVLPALIVGLPLRIHDLHLAEPRLLLRQDSAGEWNLVRAIRSMPRTEDGRIILPALSVSGATIEITDASGRHASVPDISVHAEPLGALRWHVDISGPQELKIAADLLLQPRLEHQVDVRIADAMALLGPLLPWDWPASFGFSGVWRGRISDHRLIGRLEIRRAAADDLLVSGHAAVRASAEGLWVAPENLSVQWPHALPGALTVRRGNIFIDDRGARAEAMDLKLLDGGVVFDGAYQWAGGAGSARIAWSDLKYPAGFSHSGDLTADLTTSGAGRWTAVIQLNGRSRGSEGRLEFIAQASGTSSSWTDWQWTARAGRLQWTGRPRDLSLANVSAAGVFQDSKLSLRELTIEDAGDVKLSGLRAGGAYDLRTRQWTLSLAADQVRVASSTGMRLEANLAGDHQRIEVRALDAWAAGVHARVGGSYDYRLEQQRDQQQPRPLQATLTLRRDASAGPAIWPLSLLNGDVELCATAEGRLMPLDISSNGAIVGRGLALGGRAVGDLRSTFRATADARLVTFQSQDLTLPGVSASAKARWRIAENDASASVELRELDLARLDDLLQPAPGLKGRLAAEVTVSSPLARLSAAEGAGDWRIRDLSAGELTMQHMEGRISLKDRVLTIDELHARQREGAVHGSISMDLREPQTARARLKLSRWPLAVPAADLAMAIDGTADLKLDLARFSATGEVEASVDLHFMARHSGAITIKARLTGDAADVTIVDGQVLGARIQGSGRLSLIPDRWHTADASVRWSGLDLERLKDYWPPAQGLRGRSSGSAAFSPVDDPRLSMPARLEITCAFDDAWYNGLQLGPEALEARVLLGRDRIVVNPATIHLADGQVKLWGRLTRPPPDPRRPAATTQPADPPVLLAEAELRRLDLVQLVRAVEPDAEPMIGRVSGHLTAYGPATDVRRIHASGQLRLEESELANSDIIGAVYSALRFKVGGEPAGTGEAHLRLEEGELTLSRLIYRNRGLEIRASGRLHDILLGPDSPMSADVVGSARPLRDIRLPFVADLDKVLSVLQGHVSAIQVDGTLRDPRPRSGALIDIGDELRRMILGDVQESRRAPGER